MFIIADVQMGFGGTRDPCAMVEVTSVGKLGIEENKSISKVVFDLIKSKLNIPNTRYKESGSVCIYQSCIVNVLYFFLFRAYVNFFDKKKHEIGYKGTTIAELFP